MYTIKNSTHKKIYWSFLFLSLIIGFLVYKVARDQFSLEFLIFFSGIPFYLFVVGSFGLLWSKLKPTGDELYITHALLIGALFIILFFIHTWVILPSICPDFGTCLGS